MIASSHSTAYIKSLCIAEQSTFDAIVHVDEVYDREDDVTKPWHTVRRAIAGLMIQHVAAEIADRLAKNTTCLCFSVLFLTPKILYKIPQTNVKMLCPDHMKYGEQQYLLGLRRFNKRKWPQLKLDKCACFDQELTLSIESICLSCCTPTWTFRWSNFFLIGSVYFQQLLDEIHQWGPSCFTV